MKARLKVFTVSQLKKLASDLDVDVASSASKSKLIDAILDGASKTKLTKEIKNSKELSWVPDRYLKGLSEKEQVERIKEIYKRKDEDPKDPKSYRPAKTDKGKSTSTSKYTKAFNDMYPNAKSLEQKAKATGVPKDILQKVYDKGLAAWRGGNHRPGASQQAWGYARVHSFLMKGCTYYTADKKLVEEAKERSKKATNHWKKVKCICDKQCK
jgi:hypothetical protein